MSGASSGNIRYWLHNVWDIFFDYIVSVTKCLELLIIGDTKYGNSSGAVYSITISGSYARIIRH